MTSPNQVTSPTGGGGGGGLAKRPKLAGADGSDPAMLSPAASGGALYEPFLRG